MSISCKTERSLLSYEEFTMVLKTHHPAIRDIEVDELHSIRKQLRELRDKETRFAEHKGRVARGKAQLRGTSFPGTAEKPKRRKQVFSNALKRLNSEIERSAKLASRAALVESAHRALALKRANTVVHHPLNDDTPDTGMSAKESRRRRTQVSGSKVGRVSQATKRAQAIYDSKN